MQYLIIPNKWRPSNYHMNRTNLPFATADNDTQNNLSFCYNYYNTFFCFSQKILKNLLIFCIFYTGEDTWILYEAQCVSCCKSLDYTCRHSHTDFLRIISTEKGTTSDPLTSSKLVITVKQYHC